MNNILICTAATIFLILTSHGLTFALDKNENSKNFIGSLNNVKFEFPHNYVRNVEYNGDPGWGYGKKERGLGVGARIFVVSALG